MKNQKKFPIIIVPIPACDMITKEEFIRLISDYQRWNNRMEEIGKVFDCINIFETDWAEYTNELFDFVLKKLFDTNGVDDIYWWIFEKSNNKLKMWNAEGSEIPTETIEDIWEVVKDHKIENERLD